MSVIICKIASLLFLIILEEIIHDVKKKKGKDYFIESRCFYFKSPKLSHQDSY